MAAAQHNQVRSITCSNRQAARHTFNCGLISSHLCLFLLCLLPSRTDCPVVFQRIPASPVSSVLNALSNPTSVQTSVPALLESAVANAPALPTGTASTPTLPAATASTPAASSAATAAPSAAASAAAPAAAAGANPFPVAAGAVPVTSTAAANTAAPSWLQQLFPGFNASAMPLGADPLATLAAQGLPPINTTAAAQQLPPLQLPNLPTLPAAQQQATAASTQQQQSTSGGTVSIQPTSVINPFGQLPQLPQGGPFDVNALQAGQFRRTAQQAGSRQAGKLHTPPLLIARRLSSSSLTFIFTHSFTRSLALSCFLPSLPPQSLSARLRPPRRAPPQSRIRSPIRLPTHSRRSTPQPRPTLRRSSRPVPSRMCPRRSVRGRCLRCQPTPSRRSPISRMQLHPTRSRRMRRTPTAAARPLLMMLLTPLSWLR